MHSYRSASRLLFTAITLPEPNATRRTTNGSPNQRELAPFSPRLMHVQSMYRSTHQSLYRSIPLNPHDEQAHTYVHAAAPPASNCLIILHADGRLIIVESSFHASTCIVDCRYDPCNDVPLEECATSVEPMCRVDSNGIDCIKFEREDVDGAYDCFSLAAKGPKACNAAVKPVTRNDTTDLTFNAEPRACYYVRESAGNQPACLNYNKCRILTNSECNLGGATTDDGGTCFWNMFNNVCDLQLSNPNTDGVFDNNAGGSGSGLAAEGGACKKITSRERCDDAICKC